MARYENRCFSWAPALAAALLVTGCSEPDRQRRDSFTVTGELVALSGGDTGAQGACLTCHGLRGRGDGQSTPWIAGMPAGYLQKQLEDYAAGLRQHEAMGRISKGLDQQDRRAVAEYYAAMPRPQALTPAASVSAAAEAIYQRGDPSRELAACASCHGPRGEGLGPANPPLAGQPRDYVAKQLDLWHHGLRRNDPRGLMVNISRRLTRDEASALGRYVEGLSPAAAPGVQGPAASPS